MSGTGLDDPVMQPPRWLTRLRRLLSTTFPRTQVVSLTEVTVAVGASSAWGFFIGWLTWGRS